MNYRTLFLVLTVLIFPASAADKPRYVPNCRPLTLKGDNFSHCLSTVVSLKSQNLSTGQRFLVLGERPPISSPTIFYDLTLDVLLYYEVGTKLQQKTRDGEDQWSMHYAAAVYWCLYEAGKGKIGEASGRPSACGSRHGIWPRQFQGRGPGGMSPEAIAKNILYGTMPELVREIPAPPPPGEWRGYSLTELTTGKKPGELCKRNVLNNREQARKIFFSELRGIPVPPVGDGKASVELCDGNDIVVRTFAPQEEIRCKVEPPYDVSDIDTIAGNCARIVGDRLKTGRIRL